VRSISILEHPEIQRVGGVLSKRNPAVYPDSSIKRAAVAVIFRAGPDGEPELLFIRRAEFAGDPWSGHVAFPGGRHEDEDSSLEETAIRETREETGIDLSHSGRILGALDDIQPQMVSLPALVVRPFVAVVLESPMLTLADEVAAAFWVPLASLSVAESWRDTEVVAERSVRITRRAFHHDSNVIWGITERIVAQLLSLIPRAASG